MDLRGRTAIVTGGSGGLGGRICHALACSGVNVAVVYNKGLQAAQNVVEDLRSMGVEAEPFRCDVTEPEQIDSMASQVQAMFGRVETR